MQCGDGDALRRWNVLRLGAPVQLGRDGLQGERLLTIPRPPSELSSGVRLGLQVLRHAQQCGQRLPTLPQRPATFGRLLGPAQGEEHRLHLLDRAPLLSAGHRPGLGPQRQQGLAHLGPLVEALAAADQVGNAAVGQRLLDRR